MRDCLAKFILKHGDFSDTIMHEDIPFIGNCSAIDTETDHNNESWIQQELLSGNECAWCVYCVTVKLAGFAVTAYLDGCSYESFNSLHNCEFETQRTEAAYLLADRLLDDHAAISQILDSAKHGMTLERLLQPAK